MASGFVLVAVALLLIRSDFADARRARAALLDSRRALEARVRERTSELAQREQQLSLLIADSPVALAMLDRDMKYLAASQRWMTDHGVSGDIIGGSHYDVLSVPEPWKDAHRRALGGSVERSDEDSFVRPDGTTAWQRREIRPWRTPQGDVGGIVIFSEDITARKQADRALRESEERFRQIAETIGEVFWMTDATKTELTYISPAYARIWGRSCESVYASPADWLEAIVPEDRVRVERAAKLRQPYAAYEQTYRIVQPGGAVRWIHDSGVPDPRRRG